MTDPALPRTTRAPAGAPGPAGPGRRQVLTLAAAGLFAAAATASCGSQPEPGPAWRRRPIPSPRPGRALEVLQAPPRRGRILWTVDDGADADVVAAYVEFARTSGTPLTFCPLPSYRSRWEPQADALRRLVDSGQVQLVNHTATHRDLTRLDDAAVRRELSDAETWIQDTFGVTARPYWRPPFGAKDRRVKAIAGELGYTRVLLWNASFGDAGPVTTARVRDAARRGVRPGAVILGHANQPAVLPLLGEITELARESGLRFATPDEVWGTSRLTG